MYFMMCDFTEATSDTGIKVFWESEGIQYSNIYAIA